MDYGLQMNMLPHSSQAACLQTNIYRARFGTCSCDTHCSWDLCRSSNPPPECLLGTDSVWKLDNAKDAWVAQILEGNVSH